jgi:hypothetical protein
MLKPHRAALSLTVRPNQHRAAPSVQLDLGSLRDGRGGPENQRDDLDNAERALTVIPTEAVGGAIAGGTLVA